MRRPRLCRGLSLAPPGLVRLLALLGSFACWRSWARSLAGAARSSLMEEMFPSGRLMSWVPKVDTNSHRTIPRVSSTLRRLSPRRGRRGATRPALGPPCEYVSELSHTLFTLNGECLCGSGVVGFAPRKL